MEVDDKLLAEELKEKQKSCTDMNQLQALWTDMANKQVLKPKPPPVPNAEKKEQKTYKKRGSLPKAKVKVELDEMPGQESNQNINYAYGSSQFHCLECGDQTSDFNWFAKHVAEHKREPMEIDSDPLKNLKTEDGLISNPWTGKDISAFLKYCCPECEFNNLDSQVFTEHALENHINATALFSQKIGAEFEPDIKIELEDEHFVDISNVDEIKDLDLKPIKTPRKKKGLVKQKQESIVQEQVLCEVCPILDLTTSALKIRSHKHKNHKNGKQFCCPHCEYTSPLLHSWSKMLTHINSNHQEHYEDKFFCDFCAKGFLFLQLYTNHKKFAHVEKEKIHICDTCGNHYKTMEQLRNHVLLKHDFEGKTKLFCEKCGYSTISKIVLRGHMDRKHNSEKHKKCPYCEYTSPFKNKVHAHIDNNHPEKEEKNFLCEKCNKSFIYKATFSDHSKYKCKYSGYSDKRKEQSSKSYMKNKSKHNFEGATKLFCEKCGYSTISKSLLRTHMDRKHNIEKHMKCQYCEYRSPLTAKLHAHIDNNHPEKEEKNFLCEKCNRSFIYKATFSDHSKYKCKYSGYLDKRKEQSRKSKMKNKYHVTIVKK